MLVDVHQRIPCLLLTTTNRTKNKKTTTLKPSFKKSKTINSLQSAESLVEIEPAEDGGEGTEVDRLVVVALGPLSVDDVDSRR